VQFLTAALFSLIAFFSFDGSFAAFKSASGTLSLLYLGLLSTCLCYLMQTAAQRYVASGPAALILSMEAFFGAVLSIMLGYDPASPRLIFGGALILISVTLPELVVILRKPQKTKTTEPQEE
jgi:drug/metabolite transporter (DMT)-like permease